MAKKGGNVNKRLMLIKEVRDRPFIYDLGDEHYKDNDVRDLGWREIAEHVGFVDANYAKREWKRIRDNFRDSLKRRLLIKQRATETGKEVAQPPPYRYQRHLNFLLPYLGKMNIKIASDKPQHGLGESDEESANAQHLEDDDGDDQPNGEVQDLADYVARAESAGNQPKAKKSKIIKTISTSMIDNEEGETSAWSTAAKKPERNGRGSTIKESGKRVHPLNHFFRAMCASTKRLPPSLQQSVKRKVFNIVDEAEEQSLEMYGESGVRGSPSGSEATSSSSEDEDTPNDPDFRCRIKATTTSENND